MIEVTTTIDDLGAHEAVHFHIRLKDGTRSEVWQVVLERGKGKGAAYLMGSDFGKPARAKKLVPKKEQAVLPGY